MGSCCRHNNIVCSLLSLNGTEMIKAQFELGWFVDHQLLINSHYVSVATNSSNGRRVSESDKVVEDACLETRTFTVKPDVFSINWPFMMDSQFQKYKNSLLVKRDEDTKLNPLSSSEELECEQVMKKALNQLAEVNKYFCLPSDCNCPLDNNVAARNVAASLDVQYVVCSTCADTYSTSYKPGTRGACGECMRGKLVTMTSPGATVLHCGEDAYLIPANCSFLLSDVRDVSPLLEARKTFDLIVLDPPWENKSVKRKRSYNWLSDSDLANIPIGRLANKGCLLAVWATNNERQLDTVNSVLFPAWHVTPVAQWFWIKVTRHGQPVLPLSGRHKKPYERLLIGRVTANDSEEKPEDVPIGQVTASDSEESKPDKPVDIPSARVIVSVPSGIHSSKPPLTEVLKPYLPDDCQCLEIFARSLLPGWTSWGNEVLKLQHSDLFIDQGKLK